MDYVIEFSDHAINWIELAPVMFWFGGYAQHAESHRGRKNSPDEMKLIISNYMGMLFQ